jgi:hypothetical protein
MSLISSEVSERLRSGFGVSRRGRPVRDAIFPQQLI